MEPKILKASKMDKIEQREALLEIKQCMGCAHEGMIVTSLDGMIVEAAPAAEHILGTPSLTLKGRPIHEFCADPNAYDEICRQTIRDGKVLNRSMLLFGGSGKRKLVNVSIQVSGIAEA